MCLLALVVLHILALHEVGSNNPDGVDIKKHKDENGIPLDGIPFHPYYTVKDIVGVIVFLFVFCFIVFFFPEMGGYFLEKPNFEQANALKTPDHIAPVWYFTPFYAILRAVPDKLLGVVAMGGAIAVLFVLPWLDRSPVKINALQRLAEQDLVTRVLHQLCDSRCARCIVTNPRAHIACTNLYYSLLRLFHSDAFLHQNGKD